MLGIKTVCDLWLISKETFENSWDILNAILGLRCLQNHPVTATKLGNEATICQKSGFDYTVCSVV